MNLPTLRRFSEEGYAAIPPIDFSDAADFCREQGENLGDLRFFLLGSCFDASYERWTPGEAGMAPGAVANALQDLWKRSLPAILDSDDPEEAAKLARELLSDIRALV